MHHKYNIGFTGLQGFFSRPLATAMEGPKVIYGMEMVQKPKSPPAPLFQRGELFSVIEGKRYKYFLVRAI
jgi:hypothetical protein